MQPTLRSFEKVSEILLRGMFLAADTNIEFLYPQLSFSTHHQIPEPGLKHRRKKNTNIKFTGMSCDFQGILFMRLRNDQNTETQVCHPPSPRTSPQTCLCLCVLFFFP